MTFCFETVCSGFCGYFWGGLEGERSEPDPRVGWHASEVRASVLIELRQGSGGVAPGIFLGDFTFKSAFLQ